MTDTSPPGSCERLSAELWCCHVIGPDDIYAAPDKVTAEVWADQTNGMLARRGFAGDVICRAEAAPWPWSAEAHAIALARAVKDMTTPGVMAALAQSRPSPPGPDAGELREVGKLAVKALRSAAFEMSAAIPNLRNKKRAEWLAAGALANEAVATGLEAALRTSEEGAGRG